MADFTPYSTLRSMVSSRDSSLWMPDKERDRVVSYQKYDQMYWNDESQFSLRVLEGEEPVYIPNPRTIVDTTSYYLLKGLQLQVEDPEKNKATQAALDQFLKREAFYSRFASAKHSGVARGDWVFHLTADPRKTTGSRLSLNPVHPGQVFVKYDPEDCTKLIEVTLIEPVHVADGKSGKKYIKRLTYSLVVDGNAQKRIHRAEAIVEFNEKWWGKQPDIFKVTLPPAMLPAIITTIPVYWFKNIDWDSQDYGSSELRGFEKLFQDVDQATTDQGASLALEGLGVYSTDGGRPVDASGNETDWEIAPGKVMEVPTGSYFRRVEGLSTLKPSMDHINYLESKMREAGGVSDVALGRVDVQTAASGIALAIKFIPTLAKIDERDQAGVDKLIQMFFDWKTWYAVFEGEELAGDILVHLAEKLPQNDDSIINQLNNMFDRDIIPATYYRERMSALGWIFPDDIEEQLEKEAQTKIARQREVALINANQQQQDNGVPPPPGKGGQGTLPPKGNQSNNAGKPNESSGTEATQSTGRQARGGKSRS